MANNAIILNWGNPILGREQLGMGVFMSSIEFYGKLKGEGKIEDFKIYLNESGDISANRGSMVIEGSQEQLTTLQNDLEYQTLLVKAYQVVNNLTINSAVSGDNVMKRVELLQGVYKDLGIVE